jgi:hypothetical protein
LLPIRDARRAIESAVAPAGFAGLALVAASLCAAWWLYVPIHELLHALGCWATGGDVTRLEIDAVYGAALLRRLFPFVAVGSSYAGQLTGFETHGSDLVYLATDLTPFALTVLMGVPLLQAVPTAFRRAAWRAVALGVAAPVAYAPFLSLGADYYEIGSVLVTRAAMALGWVADGKRWRSDDLVKLATHDLPANGGRTGADIAFLAAGFSVGAALAFATYFLGALFLVGSRWLGRVLRRSRPEK